MTKKCLFRLAECSRVQFIDSVVYRQILEIKIYQNPFQNIFNNPIPKANTRILKMQTTISTDISPDAKKCRNNIKSDTRMKNNLTTMAKKYIHRIGGLVNQIREIQIQNGYSVSEVDEYVVAIVRQVTQDIHGKTLIQIVNHIFTTSISKGSEELLINIIKCLQIQIDNLSEAKLQVLESIASNNEVNNKKLLSLKNKKYSFHIHTDSLPHFSQANQVISNPSPKYEKCLQNYNKINSYGNNFNNLNYLESQSYATPKSKFRDQEKQRERDTQFNLYKEKYSRYRQMYMGTQDTNGATENTNQLDSIERSIYQTLEKTKKLRKLLQMKASQCKQSQPQPQPEQYLEPNPQDDQDLDLAINQIDSRDIRQNRLIRTIGRSESRRAADTSLQKSHSIRFETSLDRFQSIFID